MENELKKAMCEIRIYDRGMNWLAETVLAESVQLTRELYAPGYVEVHIHPDKKGAAELVRRGNIITIDGDPHKSAIIRDFKVSEKRNVSELIIYGTTPIGMAKQRITVPPTQAQDPNALGWDKVSGSAETVLKHYVSRNMTAAYDSKRNFPRLVIAENKNRGIVFPWKSRYAALHDELFNIGNYAEMGFEIVPDIASKRWIFDVIEGTDRTRGSGIMSPVAFNLEWQNVEGYIYSEDYQNYRSTGYAGGQGEDEKRLIYALGAGVAGDDRWETFLDCGNASDIMELKYYGEQKMNEYKEAKTVEANALPKVFSYERDYFLGDLVTVTISRLGIDVNTRITSVKTIWERDKGKRDEIRFGGKLPTIFSILNRRGEVY